MTHTKIQKYKPTNTNLQISRCKYPDHDCSSEEFVTLHTALPWVQWYRTEADSTIYVDRSCETETRPTPNEERIPSGHPRLPRLAVWPFLTSLDGNRNILTCTLSCCQGSLFLGHYVISGRAHNKTWNTRQQGTLR